MQSLPKFFRDTYLAAQPGERGVVMKNAAFLSLLQIISYLLPIIIVPYLFRVLGPDKFGLIAFAQAFTQFFVILTDYGFNISATREISLCGDETSKISRIFSSVMTVKAALVLLSLILLAVALLFLPRFRDDPLLYILNFGTVIGIALFPSWFFQGKEKMSHITIINILGGLIMAPLIFIFVKSPQDYLLVPLINSCSFLITGILGQYIVSCRFAISFQLQGYDKFLRQLASGWNIFISIAAINAYTSMRIVILGLLSNNSLTGFYSMAENIANAFQTFPLASFSQAIFPRLNKIFQSNKARAFEIMLRAQQISVLTALICLPSAFISAESIVKLVCGNIFEETVVSLRILLISVFFVCANAFRVQFLLVCGKTNIYSRIHVGMASLGLPLLIILISCFSFRGAAAATVVIEGGIFCVTCLVARKPRLLPG